MQNGGLPYRHAFQTARFLDWTMCPDKEGIDPETRRPNGSLCIEHMMGKHCTFKFVLNKVLLF